MLVAPSIIVATREFTYILESVTVLYFASAIQCHL